MVTEIKFLGFIFNEEGVQPNPDKISTIQNLKEPTIREKLKSFISMVNYLRVYTKHV